MTIGVRLREIREQKGLSQGDVEKATGLLRCYTSRVENGHTIPSLATLEKYAEALGFKLYQLFYTGEEPPSAARLASKETSAKEAGLNAPLKAEGRFTLKLQKVLKKLNETDRQVILNLAQNLARR